MAKTHGKTKAEVVDIGDVSSKDMLFESSLDSNEELRSVMANIVEHSLSIFSVLAVDVSQTGHN